MRGWAVIPGIVFLLVSLVLASRENPWTPLDWLNLAFHEAGHLFLLPFGETLHFLGGTLFQLLIPFGLTLRFLIRRSPFSASACLWWCGENLLGIATYMADARDLTLPLVGGGENDWNHLFYQWGLLGQDSVRRISSVTHGLGVAVMLDAAAWMLFLGLPLETRNALVEPLARRFPLLEILVFRAE